MQKTIRKIGRKIPFARQLEEVLKIINYHTYYKNHLARQGLEPWQMLVIGTIARSGTHYVMLLLANYINFLNKEDCSYGPNEMNKLFPNNWHLSYINYRNLPFGPFTSKETILPDDKIGVLGVKEVTRSHSIFQRTYWKDSQVLHLYRNPLDYSVSLYNYKHKKRKDLSEKASHPSEVLEDKFINYCEMYKSYKDASLSGKYRVLRISYEALVANPEFHLGSIIEWLGLEIDYDGLDYAIQNGSIKKTQEHERVGGIVNPGATNLVGSFISSGQVGQWKNFYDQKQFNYWQERFEAKGISLEEFILE